jgi:hypothetical protein
LARVATDLEDQQLPVELELQSTSGASQLFSVTFDPARVDASHVQQILLNAGARIIPAPVAE